MPRLPRRPAPARAVDAAAAALSRRRRREARAPRVSVRDRGGHLRTLEPDDPAFPALVAAARDLLAAAGR
jgi:hypothetical protein